jgi:hypothetical protein
MIRINLLPDAVPATHKICTQCRVWKVLDLFKKGAGRYGKDSVCKACRLKSNAEWERTPAGKASKQRSVAKYRASLTYRESVLRNTYGIGVDDWQRFFEAQGGMCAGCKTALERYRGTHVDHCHASGRVRGLLCVSCNLVLGKVKDSPETLRRLALYIEACR